ncbi:hypothetical protein HYPBUDRAFT_236835 [Hyphopichia burtonii NRRL Y-1933]|uniref:Inositol-pentakisphosphate 2-kinase n=1 Tax=Hyphopichia burtonii NRRL Y-1933 TaxID=984485 RepID=A0A1E4RS79_9ASCO|nr:hypothetical protein HYPBUDRAFT_236835 [Hyphopichia burtonii NRRL Y-1933]ODV70051.1 hypothetical protein HYPBUDRAFT_236835 [Hyphopichia burtonii NRRL Y-1933]
MEISKITSPNDWIYFAKGNANILFKYTGNNDYLRHKLLRVRLLKEDDQYISTCELYDFIELRCKHLFPQQIIDIQLIVLTTDFVNQLDNHGNQLMLKERYGLLIPNILDGNYTKQFLSKNCHLYIGNNNPFNYDDQFQNEYSQNNINDFSTNNKIDLVIFEIKPKWLYDNTSSNYCRTCLLNILKGYSRHFCPLDLLYPETIDEGLEDIFSVIPKELLTTIEEINRIPLKQLFKIFLSNPNSVFQRLKEYQRINNKNDLIKNLTSIDDVSQNLSLVMTLRDVGLFIKFEKYDKYNNIHNSQNNINNLITIENYGKFLLTCNIYDLDLKSKLKYKHWLDIEEKLQSIYNSSNPNWRYCIKRDNSVDNLET